MLERRDDEEVDLLTYHRQRAAEALAQLEANPTDPRIREQLRRELQHWRREVDRLERPDHWSSGEGDRRLF